MWFKFLNFVRYTIYSNLQIKSARNLDRVYEIGTTNIFAIMLTIKNPYDTCENICFLNDMDNILVTSIYSSAKIHH